MLGDNSSLAHYFGNWIMMLETILEQECSVLNIPMLD
jgi:hypothetical protein